MGSRVACWCQRCRGPGARLPAAVRPVSYLNACQRWDALVCPQARRSRLPRVLACPRSGRTFLPRMLVALAVELPFWRTLRGRHTFEMLRPG